MEEDYGYVIRAESGNTLRRVSGGRYTYVVGVVDGDLSIATNVHDAMVYEKGAVDAALHLCEAARMSLVAGGSHLLPDPFKVVAWADAVEDNMTAYFMEEE